MLKNVLKFLNKIWWEFYNYNLWQITIQLLLTADCCNHFNWENANKNSAILLVLSILWSIQMIKCNKRLSLINRYVLTLNLTHTGVAVTRHSSTVTSLRHYSFDDKSRQVLLCRYTCNILCPPNINYVI